MRAIILVAGVGWRLKPQTEATPKCLLEIGGKTLLRRSLEALLSLGVQDVVLVVGHLKDQIKVEAAKVSEGLTLRCVENPHFTRGNILSLWYVREEFDDDILIMDGDVLFPQELLARLLAFPEGNAIAVDERFHDSGEEQKVLCEDGWVVEVTKRVAGDPRIRGEAVGFLRLSAEAAEVLRGILEEFIDTGKDTLEYEETFRDLAVEVPIAVVEVGDLPWVEIDVEGDLVRAREAVLPQVECLDRGQMLPSA
jgi:choline kinase